MTGDRVWWWIDSNEDYQSATNFHLTSKTPIVGVQWHGGYWYPPPPDPETFTIRIWDDSTAPAPLGHPLNASAGGVLLQRTISNAVRVPTAMMEGFVMYDYYVNLSPAWTPPKNVGTYWIQIVGASWEEHMVQYASRATSYGSGCGALWNGDAIWNLWDTKEYAYFSEDVPESGAIEFSTLPTSLPQGAIVANEMIRLSTTAVTAPPVYTIFGTVTDGVAPVAGALVGLKGGHQATADAVLYTWTDDHGNFTIESPSLGAQAYVAAWKDGYLPTPDTPVTLTSNQLVALALTDLAGPNVAIGGNAWASDIYDPGYAAAYAVDNDFNTEFCSLDDRVFPKDFIVEVSKTGIDVDSIVIYWECWGYGCDRATKYTVYVTLQAPLIDDGTGSLIPNPAATWTTAYDCTAGDGGNMGSDGNGFVDPIRLASVQHNVKGVKITCRACRSDWYYCEFDMRELQVLTPVSPASNKLSDVKKLANGAQVAIAGKRATATPGGGLPAGINYIEEPDRSAGIRVDASAVAGSTYLGDTVGVFGTVRSTPQGEKYIEALQLANAEGRRPLEAVFMTSRAAATAAAQGMFVKMAGEVTDVGGDYFTICDNSVGTGAEKTCIAPIKVACGTLTKPSVGDFVRVRGVVSTDGASPVLLMRGNQYELLVESKDPEIPTDRHALPFPGKYLYPRDYILLGPFPVKPEGGTSLEQLEFDYISDATGGAVTEDTVAPNLGDAVGYYIWQRSLGMGYALDFGTELGAGDDVVCYAFYSVWSPEEELVDMVIGSDDGIVVRVNGLSFWEYDTSRGVNIGDDVFPVYLNPGWNGILFKVRNGGGPTGLASGLVEQGTYVSPGYGNSGTPIPTLGYALGSK